MKCFLDSSSFHSGTCNGTRVGGFLAVLGLRCYAQAFSSCGERGLLSGCSVWTSPCTGFSGHEARALEQVASVVLVGRLSCSAACGIFLDLGFNVRSKTVLD